MKRLAAAVAALPLAVAALAVTAPPAGAAVQPGGGDVSVSEFAVSYWPGTTPNSYSADARTRLTMTNLPVGMHSLDVRSRHALTMGCKRRDGSSVRWAERHHTTTAGDYYYDWSETPGDSWPVTLGPGENFGIGPVPAELMPTNCPRNTKPAIIRWRVRSASFQYSWRPKINEFEYGDPQYGPRTSTTGKLAWTNKPRAS